MVSIRNLKIRHLITGSGNNNDDTHDDEGHDNGNGGKDDDNNGGHDGDDGGTNGGKATIKLFHKGMLVVTVCFQPISFARI
jgi:hypothetical protein